MVNTHLQGINPGISIAAVTALNSKHTLAAYPGSGL